MKFINNKQFERFFYNYDNRNMTLDESSISIHARDIFSVLQQTHDLYQPVLFLVGPGKNGKLALELARLCAFAKIRTHLFIAQSHPSKLDLISFFKDKITFVQLYQDINDPLLQVLFDEKTLIIDGLFATGIQSTLDSHYQTIIKKINGSAFGDVLSLILPSGMTNTSEFYIKATKVICVDYALETLLNAQFPPEDIICVKSQQQLPKYIPNSTISSNKFNVFVPSLTAHSHKYNRGMILSFGGTDYFGASILALKAMQKINACMIQHFGIKKQQLVLLSQIPEIIFKNISQTPLTLTHGTPSVAVFGFGVDQVSLLEEHFHTLINEDVFFPIILDAGALPLVEKVYSEKLEKHPLVITPHLNEFANLINCSIEEVQQNKLSFAKKYAKENNVILVLKSALTLVTNGVETWVNPLSIPSLATPGSGDVLSGVIAAHLDYTITSENIFERICTAVYRHSSAAESINAHNITASMLIDAL